MKIVSDSKDWIFGAALLAFVTGGAVMADAKIRGVYGKVVPFKKNEPVEFPDFTLTYHGTTEVKSPVYPRPFKTENFEAVSPQGEHVAVKWSAGTGDIGPSRFEVGGVKYQIELKNSDASDAPFGNLKEDEMVVSLLPKRHGS